MAPIYPICARYARAAVGRWLTLSAKGENFVGRAELNRRSGANVRRGKRRPATVRPAGLRVCCRRLICGRVTLSVRSNGVVPPVRVALTRRALFLDVRDLASASDVSIPAYHASAREGGKAEKPNYAHDVLIDLDCCGFSKFDARLTKRLHSCSPFHIA